MAETLWPVTGKLHTALMEMLGIFFGTVYLTMCHMLRFDHCLIGVLPHSFLCV